MRAKGYALLTNEMVDFYSGAGKPSDVHLLNFAGEVQKTIRISPSPNMADPSIAASGDDLVLFGFMDVSPDRFLAATRRLGSDDVLRDPVLFTTSIPSAQIWGRAIAGLPGGDLILAWAEHPTAAGSSLYGGIAVAQILTSLGSTEPSSFATQVQANTARAYRPHITVTGPSDYVLAWAERQATSGNELGIIVHLTGRTRGQSPVREVTAFDARTDSFLIPAEYAQYQGEAVRPQVAFDGDAYTVVARGPDKTLRVTRVSTSGKVLCGPSEIRAISSWGAAGSLVNTRQGVLLVATGSSGDVVVHRVSQGATATPTPCEIQSGPVLNAGAKRVASSPTFESGELAASLGDPVVLVGKNGAQLIAWVERDRTVEAEAHGLVLRMLGPNLCD
jgi:hypothetical protein